MLCQVDSDDLPTGAVDVDEGGRLARAHLIGRPELDGVAALEQLGDQVAHRHLREVQLARQVRPAHGTGRVEGLEHEREVVPATVRGEDRCPRVDASGPGAVVTMGVSKLY